MRAPPTTLEIVIAWALKDPQRPALHEDGVELNYGQLANMLLQCAAWLQELGLRRGERVAVSGPGLGIQLVVLLACEALGAVTLSFQAEGDGDADFIFTQVDRVFSARPQRLPAGVRFGLLDEALVRRLAVPFEGAEPAWSPADLEEPQRISRTSGSTGASKFMVLRRRAQEAWVRNALDLSAYDRDTRLLVLGPLVMNAVFGRASNCLRAGGLVLEGHGSAIARMAPNAMYGLALQLERLLGQLPAGYVAARPASIVSGGGPFPPALRERLLAAFGGPIVNRYGGNEFQLLCDDIDATGTGVLAAGVEVRILDEAGRALPPGELGVVVVRTPAMADGYLARPAETAAAFRDGWFVTGDAGMLVGFRRLRVVGRYDELVVIGGLKVPATQLEQQLRAQPAVADAAVMAIQLQGGGVTLGIGLVLAPGASEPDGMAAVRSLQVGPEVRARVLILPEVPRMHTGKADRMAVLRMFRGD